ncbi:hypothetical protein [Croceimicrobium hydrocarbonivorans]|uniref:Uncharacterized protein n=1 Tax=Croceimicrobium hydrocarbonivorans TaxID=2761580 RepID=A0A7H0VBS5_9FLAO|nr:hypothetical protein [Croceimicrobium hydrocarbonivorans]QNR23173.1 hypothetical protein H4K34_12405 [Croceimicrobium hydrocarbonivorans]
MSELEKNRRYNIASTIRKAISAQRTLGHQDIMCSAYLSKRGKKLNSIDRSPSKNFTRLMHQYIQSEGPDKLRVELRGNDDVLLWTKTFSFDVEPTPMVSTQTDFQGLGEAEVNDLLNQKIAELRRNEELEELRTDNEQLSHENDQLKKQIEEMEEVVEAKKKVEYYANILGLAFPGLAKMLSATPLGNTLGALAGIEDTSTSTEESEKTQRETIIELVSEFMQSLDDALLGQLYLVFIELSNNPSLIGGLLAHLTQQNEQAS